MDPRIVAIGVAGFALAIAPGSTTARAQEWTPGENDLNLCMLRSAKASVREVGHFNLDSVLAASPRDCQEKWNTLVAREGIEMARKITRATAYTIVIMHQQGIVGFAP